MENDLQSTLKEISEPIVLQSGLFLVDVEIKQNKQPEIWILVDSETGGVNVDTCSQISRAIGFEIESKELFKNPYRLNVSSPGLGRPLTDKRQYAKNRGRNAKVKYTHGDEYITEDGLLIEVDESGFTLRVDHGEEKKIGFENVIEVKIIPKI